MDTDYAPSSLPECYRPHYMTVEDLEREAAAKDFGTITGVSTSFHFAMLSGDENWIGFDHFLFGDPSQGIPIAEVSIRFANQTGMRAVIGHDFDEAVGLAHKIAALANAAGARLHELKGAIDTTFLDLSHIEDFRVSVNPENRSPPQYFLEYRHVGDMDWLLRSIRFLREQDRQRVIMDIAACSAGKDGYARLDTHCQLPQSLYQNFFGDVFAHYIKPSTVVAALVTQDYHHTTHEYRPGSVNLCLLYGPNRWLNFKFDDDLNAARITARRLLSLNPALKQIDDNKCLYVDPLKFSKASPYIQPDTQSMGDPESNQMFLHFRGFEFPISTHWPSNMEARRVMGLLNYNVAQLRRPRLQRPSQAGGQGVVTRLFPT